MICPNLAIMRFQYYTIAFCQNLLCAQNYHSMGTFERKNLMYLDIWFLCTEKSIILLDILWKCGIIHTTGAISELYHIFIICPVIWLQPISPTAHWSYGPLVLRPIGPTTHWSYGPLFQHIMLFKPHWTWFKLRRSVFKVC